LALDALLETLECLRGQPRQVARLEGGLTNTNYRVTTPVRDVVVRVSSKDDSLLAIDRDAEEANSRAAAVSGAAPQVVEYVPEHSLLVVAYVPGRTFTSADIRTAANLPRLAAVCRQLHAGPRFVTDFDMFEVQHRYLATVLEHGFKLPDGYLDWEPVIERIRGVLTAEQVRTVPCNNDLLAANVIDDGSRLWLIDYEYAGNNDPCFELGNLASESSLSVSDLTTLVTTYFGREVPAKVARTRLLGAMAQYGWMLWASISAATSPVDFDFWTWGMAKYDRAVETLAGDELDALLSAAHRPD